MEKQMVKEPNKNHRAWKLRFPIKKCQMTTCILHKVINAQALLNDRVKC